MLNVIQYSFVTNIIEYLNDRTIILVKPQQLFWGFYVGNVVFCSREEFKLDHISQNYTCSYYYIRPFIQVPITISIF